MTSVWFSQFAREKGLWGAPEAIGSRNNESSPKLVIGANGAVIVVWRASPDIWMRTYQPSLGWGAADRVVAGNTAADPYTAALGYTAAVGFDRDGGLLVAWVDYQAGYTIGVRKLAQTGWQAPQFVDLGASIEWPRAAIAPNGEVFFVWSGRGESVNTLWASRYTSARGWAPVEQIPGSAPIRDFGPAIDVDRAGDALVVWQRGGPNNSGPIRIWSNRFASGQGWGEAMPLESNLPVQRLVSNSNSPGLVVNPGGDALAAWSQRGAGGTLIWASRYVKGTGWEQTRQIADAEADGASIAFDQSGNGMVVWSVLDQYSSFAGLSARHFVASKGWSSGWEAAAPPIKADAGRPVPLVPVALAPDGNGGFFLAWIEQSSDDSLWVNRFSQTSK